jgi:hypothetical protein
VFDGLFRSHLEAAYRAAGRPVPTALLEPVDPAHAALLETPRVPLFPAVDGNGGAEWDGAGRVAARAKGTMHRAAGLVKEMLFGAAASGDTLFLLLEPEDGPGAAALAGLTLRVEFVVPAAAAPATVDAPVSPGISGHDGLRVALGSALEARIPLGFTPPGLLVFRALLLDAKGRALETIPAEGWVRFPPPGPASSMMSLLRKKRPAPAP